MSGSRDKFQFAIDRGGTFTDIYARCPGGKIRVMKLLSEDPANYPDAPREGIRRILEEVHFSQSVVGPCKFYKESGFVGIGKTDAGK